MIGILKGDAEISKIAVLIKQVIKNADSKFEIQTKISGQHQHARADRKLQF